MEERGDALLGHFVDRCRASGLTWSQISAALGVTRQAVHKRFADSAPSTPARRAPGTSRRAETGGDSSLEAEFEQACRVAIEELKRLGFMPGGWIGLIDRYGARGAAHELLSSGRTLPVFQFLVEAQRVDLSMEAAVVRPRWRALFSDADREEADRRLMGAGNLSD